MTRIPLASRNQNASQDEPYGDEDRVPMQYVMWFEREPMITRYTWMLNDLAVIMGITHAERDYPDFDKACAHRAAVSEDVLWRAVKKERPVYYERAKALGWTL